MVDAQKIIDATSEGLSHALEITKDRLFSPMYFYFFLSWIVINWQFVYVFLFQDESLALKTYHVTKDEYLANLYKIYTGWDFLWNVLQLIFLPALSAFIFMWVLNRWSIIFYEKHERYEKDKRVIKNLVGYEEKVQYFEQQRSIRDAEADKNDIRYLDNKEFNDWYDMGKSNIVVGEYEFVPSESLYNNDYEAYKSELEAYKDEHEINLEDVPF